MRAIIPFRIVLAIWIAGLAACDGGRAAPAARQATAKPAAVQDPAGLLAWADSVDSLKAPAVREAAFALVGERLMAVRDSTGWPDSIDAQVHVRFDGAGRPLRHMELPFSRSGDWKVEYVHYFDEDGRTRVFASDGYYFREEGCGPGVVHDRRRTVYDPSGRIIHTENALLDVKDQPVPREACGHTYDFFAGEPQPSHAALVAAGRSSSP